MKKFIILPMFALCAMAANAQDFDSKPTVTIDNEQEDLHFTVACRFMADAAWSAQRLYADAVWRYDR